SRTYHGALLDAELLADVYVELVGGRQAGLDLAANVTASATTPAAKATREPRPPRPHAASAEELAAHEAFIESLENPVWRRD
ncbi:MAG: DNA polymerase III subunit epsilon, partial [Alphaproteobacteria bacterium]|nr:DNA polymerase III subunit epsilon [Alphaproteobacteria bacterium]